MIIYRRDRTHMPAHEFEAAEAEAEGVRIHWLRTIRSIDRTTFTVEVMELDEKGRPNIVDRALVYPPQSQLPPLTSTERESIVKQSSLFGHYEKAVDRESAYEMLKARAPQAESTTAPAGKTWQSEVAGTLSALGKSAARAMGTQVGREIMRGVLGSIFGSTATRKRR